MIIYNLLEKIRTEKPVIHHITNWVTIYDCAQVVKSLGASPVMAHSRYEAADMTSIASALVLNIGTLTDEIVEAMKRSARAANDKEIPVTLDVCGAGATSFRDQMSMELINETRIDIIKGNASEVARIAGEEVQTKGVDSAEVKSDIAETAKKLATERNCTVVVTGAADVIANKEHVYVVQNGHEMMASVVGTGCMAASVIGTFAAVESSLVKAGVAALVCFGIAAELAEAKKSITKYDFPWDDIGPDEQRLARPKQVNYIDAIINANAMIHHGPMSFKHKLMDELYNLNKDKIIKNQKVTELKI